MSPITHFLVGWAALERALPARRDKALVTLAGLAPDLDGIGIVVDFATRSPGLSATNYYQDYHRLLGHGLPAVLVIALFVFACARQRGRAALLAIVAVHLHFLCDLLGSRGNGPDDIWGIWYFAPITTRYEIAWAGQWPLVGWQNMLITAILIGFVLNRACRLGYSPLALASSRIDGEVVETLRRWRARMFGASEGKQ